MKISEICEVFERIAPRRLAEEWDNVGLLVGDSQGTSDKVMLCIDLTPDVLLEAKKKGAGMVMAYHPVIFGGIKRVTLQDQPVVYEAVRDSIAVYSMHTSLDVIAGGANDVLAGAMGLVNAKPLKIVTSKRNKIIVFCPHTDVSVVGTAAFSAGAGVMGEYSKCSFLTHGLGTFTAGSSSHPTIGRAGESQAVEEIRLEFVAPCDKTAAVCKAIAEAHSYEQPAIDVFSATEYHHELGMGRIGCFDKPVKLATLINAIKKAVGVKNFLLAGAAGKSNLRIKTAACAAGSAGAMWKDALSQGSQFYLTGEMKHHDALAAARAGLIVGCLGHSNSERMTLAHLQKQLKGLLKGVQVIVSQNDKDPFEIV